MNLLDTDAVLNLLRQGRYEEGAISVLTLIEVLRGVGEEKRGEVKLLLEESFDVLNLSNKVIITYCKIYEKLREKGETLPDADLLIAATSISKGLSIKTGDKHFERLRQFGLSVAPIQ